MNEDPQTITSRKSPTRQRFAWFVVWVVLFSITALVVVGIRHSTDLLPNLLFTALFSTVAILCVRLCVPLLSSWLAWRRILFGLACLNTLIALFYAEEDWRGWHAWNRFQRHWEAQGERFDLASVVPPPVPDDQNFALTPVVASSYNFILDPTGHKIRPSLTNIINQMAMDYDVQSPGANIDNKSWPLGKRTDLAALQQYYRTLAAHTNLFTVSPQPQTPAADVLLALSRFDSTIEAVRQAAQLPFSRFPLEYDKEDPAEILLPHLNGLQRCSQILDLRATAELRADHSDLALADIRLMQQLSDSVRAEPFLISQLVRLAITQCQLQPVWEGLADHHWSETQLTALDAQLGKLDFLMDYQQDIRAWTPFLIAEFNHLRRHPDQYENLFYDWGLGAEAIRPEADVTMSVLSPAHLVPSGWYYQNQLRSARLLIESFLPAADVSAHTFNPALARQGYAILTNDLRHPNPGNVVECLLLQWPVLSNFAGKFAFGQSSVDLARVAIALERYRLANGHYPDSLSPLDPRFLNPVPHDVIGGQPLHYHLTADGQFVLYSIGWNETDDGGTVAFKKSPGTTQDIEQGDWVWSYPQP